MSLYNYEINILRRGYPFVDLKKRNVRYFLAFKKGKKSKMLTGNLYVHYIHMDDLTLCRPGGEVTL